MQKLTSKSPTTGHHTWSKALRAGRVCRRADLAGHSTAIDRHLAELVSEGRLQKLSQGLYYVPRMSRFGALPPADDALVRAFLGEPQYLMFSPASYHALGLGTTQLSNLTRVYNHKRHGLFTFAGRTFDFKLKPRFPKTITPEFLLVDLLNNLDTLAEDAAQVLALAQAKLAEFDLPLLKSMLLKYGSVAVQKRVAQWLVL
jgi:hypothetical protein